MRHLNVPFYVNECRLWQLLQWNLQNLTPVSILETHYNKDCRKFLFKLYGKMSWRRKKQCVMKRLNLSTVWTEAWLEYFLYQEPKHQTTVRYTHYLAGWCESSHCLTSAPLVSHGKCEQLTFSRTLIKRYSTFKLSCLLRVFIH